MKINFEDGWWDVYDGDVLLDGFDNEKDAALFIHWYLGQHE